MPSNCGQSYREKETHQVLQFKDPCQAITICYRSCGSHLGPRHLLFGTESSAGISPQFFISLSGFSLLPQSSHWRRMVFCFLKFSLSEMKAGTPAWQTRFFPHAVSPNSSRICQGKKSTHGLEQGTAGFNAFPKKKLFCVNVWKVLESIPYSISLHGYNPFFFNSFSCRKRSTACTVRTGIAGAAGQIWQSLHLNLFHVIRLPRQIYGLDKRLVSLLLYNRDTGKSRSAKRGENLVYVFEIHHALWVFRA